jgi:hypothetical protein
MVKDMGSPDLRRKNVEVEPYFTVDKSATSDIYLKKDRKSKKNKAGSFEYPKLGASHKARTNDVIEKVFQRFISGKKKLTRGAAGKIVHDLIGRGRKGASFDKASRDKVLDVLTAYGMVQESVSNDDNLLTESALESTDPAMDRWSKLAGLGSDK